MENRLRSVEEEMEGRQRLGTALNGAESILGAELFIVMREIMIRRLV